MIKINLLPDEFKKKKKKKKTEKVTTVRFDLSMLGPHSVKIAIYSIAVFVAFHFFLGTMTLLKAHSLKSLDSRWRTLQPKKTEIEHLKSEIASLEKNTVPIRNLVKGRISWSKKLNRLSDLITPGIWLTKISLERGDAAKTLNMEGCAASLYGEETALVGKFIKAIEQDKEFRDSFSEIKLGTMEKTTVGQNPVMTFKVSCFFRKD